MQTPALIRTSAVTESGVGCVLAPIEQHWCAGGKALLLPAVTTKRTSILRLPCNVSWGVKQACVEAHEMLCVIDLIIEHRPASPTQETMGCTRRPPCGDKNPQNPPSRLSPEPSPAQRPLQLCSGRLGHHWVPAESEVCAGTCRRALSTKLRQHGADAQQGDMLLGGLQEGSAAACGWSLTCLLFFVVHSVLA
jgi:hypothetical protein